MNERMKFFCMLGYMGTAVFFAPFQALWHGIVVKCAVVECMHPLTCVLHVAVSLIAMSHILLFAVSEPGLLVFLGPIGPASRAKGTDWNFICTLAAVVLRGPLPRVQSLETSKKCSTACALCGNTSTYL